MILIVFSYLQDSRQIFLSRCDISHPEDPLLFLLSPTLHCVLEVYEILLVYMLIFQLHWKVLLWQIFFAQN